MISIKDTEDIHKLIAEMFGGSQSVRDDNALASALAKPFQTFENKDVYPTVLQKAAALIESILVEKPFIDGNKGTGYVMMRIFLVQNGLDITATQDEKYDLVMKIASGIIKFDEVVRWLEKNTSIKSIY